MTKTLKRTLLLTFACFIISIVTAISINAIFAIANVKTKNNQIERIMVDGGVEFSFETVPEFIEIGNRYLIPSATATKDGQSKIAVSSVTFPDGTNSVDSYVKLNVGGKYFISWYVNFDGQIYKCTKSFMVGYSNNTLFETDENTFVTVDCVKGQDNGVLISSKKNGVVKYSLPLNLKEMQAGSQLVEFKILSSSENVSDFSKVSFVFTDVVDKNNFFTVQISDGGNVANVRAGASGQALCGLNNGIVDQSSLGGTQISSSFINGQPIKLYYSNKDLSLSVANGVNGDRIALVSSFNDEYFYSSKTLWNGFSTGEVQLTISFEGQTSEKAEILLLSLCGKSLSGKITDVIPPVISVDVDNIDSVPTGFVGVTYPLFNATAYDANDKSEVIVERKVFKNYGKQDMIDCSEDTFGNTFIPSSVGNYTIQYIARDNAGNKAIETVDFTVERYYSAPKLELLFDMPTLINPGEIINLNDYVTKDGSGKINTKIYLLQGNQTIELNGVFDEYIPGDYVIRYSMTDFTNMTEIVDFNVKVENTTVPTFINIPKVNDTILNGTIIEFSEINAIYYNENSKEILPAKVNIEVEYDEDKTTVTERYKAEVNNHGDDIKIIYTATNPITKEQEKEEITVKVLKPFDEEESLHLDRLFVTENIDQVIKASDKITFVANDVVDNAKISYANSFVANGFVASLRFTDKDSQTINYSDIKITLVDSENKEIAVDLYITKRTPAYTTSHFGINKKDTVEITSTFFGNYNKDFNLSYVESSRSIIDGNNAKVLGVIEKTKHGKPFNGFESNKIYVSFELLGCNGASAISIKTLGNQPMTATTGDYVAPQINKLGEINNFVLQGEEIFVPAAVATDAIVGNLIPYVTVTAPDKTIVYDNVDISQGFSFKATQCGVYMIDYSVFDGNETTMLNYTVTARSTVTPIISVNGKIKNGKVGQNLTIPPATVKNLANNDYFLYVIIINPNGRYDLVEKDNYIPEIAGKYVIRYYARDVYYNFSYVDYEITIS